MGDLLSPALRDSSLVSLDISVNSFSPDGFDRIIKSLPVSVRDLNIFSNQLGEEGMKHIAKIMCRLDKLSIYKTGIQLEYITNTLLAPNCRLSFIGIDHHLLRPG